MVRLERASHVAGSLAYSGEAPVDRRELARSLNNDPLMRALVDEEDPPCGFFTENVTFHGGNYTCYAGINDHALYILRHMLRGGLGVGTPIKESLRRHLSEEARSVLRVSHYVARRNGHEPWLEAQDFAKGEIQVADGDVRRWDHFVLTPQALNRCHIIPGTLEPFTVSVSRLIDETFIVGGDPDSWPHPMNARPLAAVGDDLVVALPCGLAPALRHRLVSHCRDEGVLATWLDAYWESVDQEVEELFKRMGYSPLGSRKDDAVSGSPIRESLWRFDLDKVCCLIRAGDAGEDYDASSPWQTHDGRDLSRLVDERVRSVSADFANFPGELLVIVMFVPLGRRGSIAVTPPTGQVRLLLLDSEALEVMVKQRDADNLTLWKFVRAYDELQRRTRLCVWSVLDAYAMYVRGEGSFYFGDHGTPDLVQLGPEFHHDLVVKAGRLAGLHAVKRDASRLRDVIRFDDGDSPIWVSPAGPGPQCTLLVEALDQPVWVRLQAEAAPSLRQASLAIVKAVAYWIWHLADVVRPWMVQADELPIEVAVELGEGFWTRSHGDTATRTGKDIAVTAADGLIRLQIPSGFGAFIALPRNEADRALVAALVKGFAALIGVPMPDKGIGSAADVVDRVAPLGFQKMLLAPDVAEDPRLVPFDLPQPRLLQQTEMAASLEGLADVVRGGLGLPVGEVEVPSSQFKQALSLLIAHAFGRLKDSVAQFQALPLLAHLHYQNEAALKSVAELENSRLMMAACYPKSHQRGEQAAESMSKAADAALALRFLVEFTVAEWPRGTRDSVPDSEYDDLLALAHSVYYWGSLSEEIKGRLLRPRVTLLRSGRIGVEAAPRRLQDFVLAKVLEARERQARDLLSDGLEEDAPNARRLLDELNAVYQTEFGVTAAELTALTEGLMQLGVRNQRSIVKATWTEIVSALGTSPGWSESKTLAGLRVLSQVPGRGWPALNAGREAQPWVFKRAGSYLRRPIIQIGGELSKDAEAAILFSVRQLAVSVRHLGRSILSGDLPAEQAVTPAMKKFLGGRLDARGSRFEHLARRKLSSLTTWRIQPKVEIGPGKLLDNEIDLGDVDLFCIDESRSLALALECKAISFARNPREMAGELDDLFRHREGRSKADKHLARVKWMQEHWPEVGRALRLPRQQPWTLVAAILVEQEIPAAYLIDPPLPVVALSAVERTRAEILLDLVPGANGQGLSI